MDERIKLLGEVLTVGCKDSIKDVDRVRVVVGLAHSNVKSLAMGLLQYSLLAMRRAGINEDDAMTFAALGVGRAYSPELDDIQLKEIDENPRGKAN